MRAAICSVLMVSLLALAGCSNGDDGASTTTTSSTTFPTTTSVSVPPPGKPNPADQKAVEAAVLRKSDLAGAWKAAKWPTGDQPFFARASGDCKAIKAVDETTGLTAVAHSQQFLSPTSLNLAMRIQVFPTAAEAEAVMGAFVADNAAQCISSSVSVLQSSQGNGGSAALDLGRSAVTVPGAVAFFGTVKAGSISLGVGYAVALAGRAVVLVTAAGPGTQVPAFTSYLTPVMKRLSVFE